MQLTTKISKTKKYTPQEDFYKYVNKDWLLSHPMPDSESRWGTFDLLRDKTAKQLKSICQQSLKQINAKKGSNTQIIRDFYASGMDMKKRNSEGYLPLKKILSDIDKIKSDKELVIEIAKLNKIGINPLFKIAVDKDVKNPDKAMLYIWQGGLGLPDRDYYLEDTDDMKKIREKYLAYYTKLAILSGEKKAAAKKNANTAFEIELRLAKIARPREILREIDKNYLKYSVKKAESEFTMFKNNYLSLLGADHLTELIIQQPEVLAEVDKMIIENTEAVKTYLKFYVLHNTADFLSTKFTTAKFEMFGKTIQGLKKEKPLWKRVILTMQGRYGTPLTEALGPLYIEKYFAKEGKVILYEMIENIKVAFKKRVEKLDWMDENTKKLVYKKVDKITFKLAYPDNWEDISKIGVGNFSYIQNQFKVEEYEFNKKIKEAGGPANWDEWVMKPTIVNACADQMREMTFPAAFFQDEFFDPKTDMATNYGSAGSVMGHELSHFVDDQGCKYDATGKLNDWWPAEVKKAYKEGSTAFVKHYNKFSVDGVPVNGEFTQGENIGDVAGLMIAYDALQEYIQKSGDNKVINGLTPEQRFFIGYSKVDCGHMRLERRKDSYKTDPHAPGEVRINAALSIVPEFQKAFNIKKGDPMYIDPKTFPKLW